MIIIRLMGGLGNQMFQYAAGKALALYHATSLKLDLTWFEEDVDGTPRVYELGIFDLPQKFAEDKDIARFREFGGSNRISRFITNRMKNFPYYRKNYVIEQSFCFNKAFFNAPKNCYLEGYWQTEKYFLHIEETIRQAFTFSKPLSKKNLETAKEINECESVSIHVRRGDFVSHPDMAKQHGGICDKPYYHEAIRIICDRTQKPAFFVFSDDIPWARENLCIEHPVRFIDWNPGINSYRDMHLMSLCKYNIIANSSFSWWGAWLNQNVNKIVVAPGKWFNDSTMDISDLIPEGWVKIF